jgi:membrane protease YdiL (CAAX protease family)
MSPRTLLARFSADLLWAVLIGTALLIPHLLWEAAHPVYTNSYSMKAFPRDDQALAGWLRSQPGVEHADVSRTEDAVELRFRGPLVAPPWKELGYEFTGKVRLAQSLFNVGDPKTLVEMVLFCQAGFLIIGLRRLRRARAAGDALPALFEGKTLPAVVWGVLAGGLLLGFGLLYAMLLRRLLGPSASDSLWTITRDFPLWGKALILLGGALVAPVAEEVFFRGAHFGAFAGAGRSILGAAVTSIVFATCHLDLVNFVAYVVVGVVLAWLYLWTRSIAAPIAAHLVNNAVALAILFHGG